MSSPVIEKGQPYLTANANLSCFSGPGELIGVFVSSASNTPLLTVNDSANANVAGNGNAVVAEFVPTLGFHRMPSRLLNGLSLTISGNVVCTAFANKG